MRRVAEAIGVAPNALYTYFPTKVALLDALLDAVLAGALVSARAPGEWRDQLAEIMRASRRAVLAHPAVVPLVLARPGGVNALRLGEATLQALARGNVHGLDAVEALRALLTYTLGFAALEAPRLADTSETQRLREVHARIDALPADQFPATRAVARHLATHAGDTDFERGLSWLIGGIAGAR